MLYDVVLTLKGKEDRQLIDTKRKMNLIVPLLDSNHLFLEVILVFDLIYNISLFLMTFIQIPHIFLLYCNLILRNNIF